jgi:hypothetical protein
MTKFLSDLTFLHEYSSFRSNEQTSEMYKIPATSYHVHAAVKTGAPHEMLVCLMASNLSD